MPSAQYDDERRQERISHNRSPGQMAELRRQVLDLDARGVGPLSIAVRLGAPAATVRRLIAESNRGSR